MAHKPQHVEEKKKPQTIEELEDALLLAIVFFTMVTWVVVIMRAVTG